MKKVFTGVGCFMLAAMLTTGQANAQGCSDAGVCTIHAIKNNTSGSTGKDDANNDIVTGFAFGKGERNTSVYTTYVEYTRTISGIL